jgi:MSHA pilin protein MshB
MLAKPKRFFISVFNNKASYLLKGSSQLEFVTTLLIAGIIVWVFLPKISTNVDDAHRLSVQYTGRALNSAIHIAHLQWIAMGQPQQVDRILDFGDENIATSDKGWPTDANRGLESSHSVTIRDDLSRCRRLWNALLVTTRNTSEGKRTFKLWDAYEISTPIVNVCRYTYKEGSYLGYIDYNLADGRVTIQDEAEL